MLDLPYDTHVEKTGAITQWRRSNMRGTAGEHARGGGGMEGGGVKGGQGEGEGEGGITQRRRSNMRGTAGELWTEAVPAVCVSAKPEGAVQTVLKAYRSVVAKLPTPLR